MEHLKKYNFIYKEILNRFKFEFNNYKLSNKDPYHTQESIQIVEKPVKMKNSFLNPNDGLGTLKKGVVLDNQTYEYEVNENDSSNFTILELGDESEEISE